MRWSGGYPEITYFPPATGLLPWCPSDIAAGGLYRPRVAVAREGEELPVHLLPLVEIGVQVDLRGLEGGVAQVLLHHPQVMRAGVQLAGVAVPELVGRDAGRGILPEDHLDGPGRDRPATLAGKERPGFAVTDKPADLLEGILIDKDNPDLPPFPLHPDRLGRKVDVAEGDAAELRDPHACCIDSTDHQPVPQVLDGGEELQHLAVLQVHQFLLLHPGPFDAGHGILRHGMLCGEEPVERGDGGDDAVDRGGTVGPERGEEGEEVRDHHGICLHGRVRTCRGQILPVEDQPRGVGVPPEPEVMGQPAEDLLVAVNGPLRVVPHPEVMAVPGQPL